MSDELSKSEWIKQQAYDLGFVAVGFAKAEFLKEESEKLKEWLGLGYHGEMKYLEDHFEKRTDPTLLVKTSKTVISFAFNYYNPEQQEDSKSPKISMYAYGRDYHKVVKKKMKILSQRMKDKFGDFKHRYFIDSAPILEKEWAKKSGVGWMGKHTLIINPKLGSYFFLAEMIVDFELEYDEPIEDFCGTCTKCIDACPTDSILDEGYVMDSSKCISYLTIELKDDIPVEFEDKMENWVFGCDICQQVCPWNRFSSEHEESDFFPKRELIEKKSEDWKTLSLEEYDALFFGSAVKRAGYEKFMQNILSIFD